MRNNRNKIGDNMDFDIDKEIKIMEEDLKEMKQIKKDLAKLNKEIEKLEKQLARFDEPEDAEADLAE